MGYKTGKTAFSINFCLRFDCLRSHLRPNLPITRKQEVAGQEIGCLCDIDAQHEPLHGTNTFGV